MTATRYDSAACDGGRFISSKESLSYYLSTEYRLIKLFFSLTECFSVSRRLHRLTQTHALFHSRVPSGVSLCMHTGFLAEDNFSRRLHRLTQSTHCFTRVYPPGCLFGCTRASSLKIMSHVADYALASLVLAVRMVAYKR